MASYFLMRALVMFWLRLAAGTAVLFLAMANGAEPKLAPPVIRVPSSTIQHRFLAMDESRAELVYVDQSDAAKGWAIHFPSRYRDVQLIGGGKILISSDAGYREYRFATQELLKETKGFPGVSFARRLPDGRTVLGGNAKGITVYELDPNDHLLRTGNFPLTTVRLGRLTPQGTLLFGGNATHLIEGTLDGKIVKDIVLNEAKHIYHAVRKPDGHLLVTTGYGASLLEIDAGGKVLKRWGGKQSPAAGELGFHFFAGFQLLNGGDIVVANWTGHGAKDSDKGAQLVQFDPSGKVVWAWHDPQRAGSIHGVIVLDDLDPTLLNDDRSSVLGPVTAK